MGCNCKELTPEQEELRKRINFWMNKKCPNCDKILNRIVVKDKPLLRCLHCYEILIDPEK